MSLPLSLEKAVAEIRYCATHEYIKHDGDKYFLGISDFAQNELGDITFVELPAPTAEFGVGDVCCTVESVKAVGEINAPLGLRVVTVNESLEDAPETVNSDAEGAGWLIEVELLDAATFSTLMDKATYDALDK